MKAIEDALRQASEPVFETMMAGWRLRSSAVVGRLLHNHGICFVLLLLRDGYHHLSITEECVLA